jgi:hypothetical protein
MIRAAESAARSPAPAQRQAPASASDVPVVQVSSPTSPQNVRANGGALGGGQGWSFDAAEPSSAHVGGSKTDASANEGERELGGANRQPSVEDALDEEDID